MSDGLTAAERMGTWLAENPHEVLAAARCPGSDGRTLAKVCEVAGIRWVWFASLRIAREALIANELEELRDLPTSGGGPDPGEIDEAIAELREGPSRITFPQRAFPDVLPSGVRLEDTGDAEATVNCPRCRAHYVVRYLGDLTFGVSSAAAGPLY